MAEKTDAGQRWNAQPVRAWLIRAVAFGLPILGSLVFVHVASRVVPAPSGNIWLFIGWWLTLSGAATGVLALVDRATRRLLPLAALYKLSLVFPDQAPSRFRAAYEAGNVASLEERVAQARKLGAGAETPSEAAARLIGLAAALNSHDEITHGHSDRVRAYSQMIGKELRLSPEDIDRLNWAALLHDIGKLEIPTEVLGKTGRPTDEEFALLRTHPELGAELAAPLREWLGEWFDAITQHHERWDGKGYPHGIAENKITLAGRIVAVADVFDVITSARSYKEAADAAEGRAEIARCAGEDFDPRVVRAFLGISLGRMRMVMGPLSWLAHAPLLGRLPLTPAIGTVTTAAIAVAASATTGIVTLPERAAEPDTVAERSVALSPPRPAPVTKPRAVSARVAPSLTRTMLEDSVLVQRMKGISASNGVTDLKLTAAPGAGRARTTEDFALVYQPPADFNGKTSMAYEACWTSRCATGVIRLTVLPVNDTPAADDDTITVRQDETAVVDVLTNDTDRDGDSLTIAEVPTASPGEATTDGRRIRWAPPPGFVGSTSFEYRVVDGNGGDDVARVVATVLPTPTPPADIPPNGPVAQADIVSTPEDTPISIAVLENDSRASGDVLRISSISPPDRGAVTLEGNRIRYDAPAEFHGVARFTYTASNASGARSGASVQVTVTPVNDAPSFSAGADQSVLEDAGAQSVSGWATAMSPGPADESGQAVSFSVSNDAPALFSSPPAVAPNGTLSYTPAANANGSATVSVRAVDDGGTANGGNNTSPAQTLTITVTPVNDAPSFSAGADQSVLEDAGEQSVVGWASSIDAGPGESSQSVTFGATNDAPSLFSVEPAVAPNGTLSYTPAPNANGTATVSLIARDNGGTANGGQDTSSIRTFRITVTPVNDPPSFSAGADQSVLEDAGAQSVSGWATGMSPGPADESGQAVSFSVSNDAPALFSSPPAVAPNGTLSYTPAANANGSATVSVRAVDDGGTANGGNNTSPAQTFTITVTPVNDPPSFSAGADQSVLEDAGAQSVSGWATGMSPGPADESGQAVSFSVSNDAPALFSSPPAVAPNGTLSYTPAANANGSATVSVRAVDDGGTANGGNNTSPAQTFTITVTPVNDPPSFSAGADQSVLEDAGAQSVSGWATGMSPGPADESGQAVSFSVSNDAPALFSSPPAVAPNGTLSYTPAANANGSATVSVRAVDDGGTANGGNNTSPAQTFTITVTPVNDPLVANDDGIALDEDQVGGATFDVLANDTDVDGDTVSLTSFDGSSIANGTLTPNGGGSFTYSPDADWNGVESFTYIANDGNGETDSATVTLTVSAQPDAPDAADDAYSTPANTPLSVSAPGVAVNDADPDGDALTVQTTPVVGPANGSLSLAADGSFTYTPTPGYSGPDQFTYRVDDGTGRTDDAVASITVTSVAPGPQTLFMQPTGATADTWDMSTSPPPAATPVPDHDGDGWFGLTIARSNGDEGNSDPTEWQDWSYTLPSTLDLNGPVTLQLWSAIAFFELSKDGHPHLYLYDCDGGGSNCTLIAQNDLHVGDWGGLIPDFTYQEFTVGSVNRTIAAGRTLRFKMLNGHKDLWVAHTAAYPTALVITTN